MRSRAARSTARLRRGVDAARRAAVYAAQRNLCERRGRAEIEKSEDRRVRREKEDERGAWTVSLRSRGADGRRARTFVAHGPARVAQRAVGKILTVAELAGREGSSDRARGHQPADEVGAHLACGGALRTEAAARRAGGATGGV
eukprot:2823487-Prymnesium_polylepis.1